jgi:rhodanese-related sulfurtransferase
VALTLTQAGFGDVFALKGGFDAWVQAGLPTEIKDYATQPTI